MKLLNQLVVHSDRRAAAVFAVIGIFVLFVLAFFSDRSLFMRESKPAKAEEDHVFTDADGKQHVVIVIKSDPSLHEALAEMYSETLRVGKTLAWGEVFLGVFACSFLAFYFRTARMTLRAFWEEGRQGSDLPQNAVGHALPGRWMEGTLVGVGLVGLVMALAVAILWVVIVWLDWRGALESVAGRARTVTLSAIAAKTALGSGICSLVFWIVTECAAKRTATISKDRE